MNQKLINLIQKVQNKYGEDSFEISNYSLETALRDTEEIKEVYNEGDLTKNYVKFATDLLSEKYGGEFLKEIIEGFGESLKTSEKDFKESYQKKPSSIKEIMPSVFIHTSMSKILMEYMIVTLVNKARLHVKFHSNIKPPQSWTNEIIKKTASKYQTMSEFVKSQPDAYRAAVRLGIKPELVEVIKKNKK
jgi:hypothetical protein